MATLVCFHAHPDDEAITTGGTMARAAADGHRVVLVLATGGEHGEVPPDLAEGETLAMRRAAEAARSAELLGVHAVHFLGYQDSGMTGWDQNEHPEAFCAADVDEAGERLAAILRAEDCTVLTTYDWHGNYGHPDHIAVHRVGHRAAQIAGIEHLYEATVNRDAIARQMTAGAEGGEGFSGPDDFDIDDTDDGNPFGMPEEDLTTFVDVSAHVLTKRAAIAAHASQVTDSSFFMQMPDEVFAMAFGVEWFIRVGAPAGLHETWLQGL